ncbi:hypothetical protein BJY04DRAFT_186967 [Aspergillus karnatakaensis]|uniref:uncharacterized protein n=1 Tax=Aspergillus karnatakaensis TaxID=1810916 RepID=UPI003CCE1120
MPILTPQDSFGTDSIPDTFFTMADTTTPTAATQCQCHCSHQAQDTTRDSAPPADFPFPRSPLDRRETFPPEPERGRPARPIPIRHRGNGSQRDSPSPAESPISFLDHGRHRGRERASWPFSGPTASSHGDLFILLKAQIEHPEYGTDKHVILDPYNRDAYITIHPASHFDFVSWLPLLALGVPETWYSFGVPETVITMNAAQPLAAPPQAVLKPLLDPRPVGLKIPRIAAGAALQPSSFPPVPAADADVTAAEPASEKPTPPSPLVQDKDVNLIYLSIQTTISGLSTSRNGRWISPDRNGLPELAGRNTIGQSIYRVVRSGSREEAAAQAFYNAGGNRWSTVFTCVVVEEEERMGAAGSGRVLVLDEGRYVRVGSLAELIGGDSAGAGSEKGEKKGAREIKVFY